MTFGPRRRPQKRNNFEVQTVSQGPTATPAPVTNVPGMVGVSVIVTELSHVRIRYHAKLTRADSGSGRNAYFYKRDGATGTAPAEIYHWNFNESDLAAVSTDWLELNVVPGTYTYNATYRASGNTSNSTFLYQRMEVEVIPANTF